MVLWGGWPFFSRGWASIINRSPNMFTLIALGTGTAYFYSAVATAVPEIFPHSFRDHGGRIAVYFEAAAVITVLVLLGQVLELRARSQTPELLSVSSLGLAPKTARVIRRRRQGRRSTARCNCQPGDRVRVRPGEKVPVDGVDAGRDDDGRRIDGHRRAHPGRKTSRATGSSAARLIERGPFIMRAERVGHETLLAQIVRMVAKRSVAALRSSDWPTRCLGYFVPAVIAIAVLTFVVWALVAPSRAWHMRWSMPWPS